MCLTALLYGSESWAIYRRQMRTLEKFHIRSLQSMLGISWKDKVPHVEILRRTNCTSIETYWKRNQLRWLGHVGRMSDTRIPKQLMYGELTIGSRSRGGQMLRYKDSAKKNMKDCHMDPLRLEDLISDRPTWRAKIKTGLQKFEDERDAWLRERRARRNRPPATDLQSGDFTCPECGRVCRALIGLRSHMEAHRRQRLRAGQAVIVDPDGQP